MSDLFSALFGDGTGLVKEKGRWTFVPAPGLPKLHGEGLLTYLNRLSQNCLIIKGVWSPGLYLKNQCVAYNNQMWVTLEDTSSTPGSHPWVPLFYSLTGLQGEPGRDGFDPIIQAL